MTAVSEATELLEIAERLTVLRTSSLVADLALRGSFDPSRLAEPVNAADLIRLCHALQNVGGRSRWMLNDPTRVAALVQLVTSDGPESLKNRANSIAPHFDTPLDHVLQRVLGGDRINVRELTQPELIASQQVLRWLQQVQSRTGVFTLIPPELDRDEISAQVALFETLEPIRRLTRDGCLGRDDELERLRRYVADGGPYLRLHDRPPMLVYGVGGVGKSTLVAEFVRRVDEGSRETPSAWAYLDLDRAVLTAFGASSLIDDILRQVGSQFAGTRRRLEKSRIDTRQLDRGAGLESYGAEAWREAVDLLVERVEYGEANGRLVVILDTFEELERTDAADRRAASGLSVIEDVFQMLAEVSDRVREFRLIVSGRAPAKVFDTGSSDEFRLHVTSLAGPAARELLEHFFNAEQADHPRSNNARLSADLLNEVVNAVGGSPLSLRLAARVLAREGLGGVSDAADQAQALSLIREEFVRGFLYRRILDHIEPPPDVDPDLIRSVARASLVLHSIDADLIAGVLLPTVAGTTPAIAPHRILEILRAESAVVQSDQPMFVGNEDALRIRHELRAPALLALSYEDPDLVRRIHHAAAAYYDTNPHLERAAEEALYHHAASGGSIEPVSAAVLEDSDDQFDRWVEGLSPAARAELTSVRSGAAAREDERQHRLWENDTELRTNRLLNDGRIADAELLLAERDRRSVGSPLYRVEARLHEMAGRPDAARESARLDLKGALDEGRPGRYAQAALSSALMEERLGNPGAGIEQLVVAETSAILRSDVLTRLEIHLNRLVIMERASMPIDWWVEDLDARALLQGVSEDELRSRTSLIRLLGATLGRGDSLYLRDAVRTIGFGLREDRIIDLARALADWDRSLDPPGVLLGRVAGVDEASSVDLFEAWSQQLIGRQSDIGLADLWNEPKLSPEFLAALRQIYVWWGIEPTNISGSGSSTDDTVPGQFLYDQPNFLRTEFQQLEQIVIGAYPNQEDLEDLASRIHLEPSAIDWQRSVTLNARDFLVQAAEGPGLSDTVAAVLADPNSRSYHAELRNLVGDEWLRANVGDLPNEG